MGKTYILNPTPLLMIGNPKKRKRVKTNKSKSHGGEKEMSKKRHHAKKAKSNPKRHRRAIAKSNPKRHRSVKVNHRRRRAVAKVNPKRRHHYAKNPIVVRHRSRRRVKKNPDFMKIGLEGLKFGGLVTIGMIGTSLIPQYALSAMNVQNEGVVKYGSELVTGGVLAWVSSLFKQDFEVPILAGAIATVLIQGLGDVISGIGNNMKISGYGYLPAQQVPNQIGAGNYGQFNAPVANQVANGVYA